jgi:hypothetical protein
MEALHDAAAATCDEADKENVNPTTGKHLSKARPSGSVAASALGPRLNASRRPFAELPHLAGGRPATDEDAAAIANAERADRQEVLEAARDARGRRKPLAALQTSATCAAAAASGASRGKVVQSCATRRAELGMGVENTPSAPTANASGVAWLSGLSFAPSSSSSSSAKRRALPPVTLR